jgi:hypothetical protein
MEGAHSFTPQEMEMYREVSEFTLKTARPLVWQDPKQPWPKRLFIQSRANGRRADTRSHQRSREPAS